MRILAIAEHGSVSQAARALHIAQPALSKTLQGSEAYLGAALFVRANSGVQLTAAGGALIEHARAIRGELERADKSMKLLREGQRRRVTIGIAEVPPLVPTAQALLKTQEAFPELTIRVEVASFQGMVDQLLSAQIDFIFGALPDQPPRPTIVEKTVYIEEAIIACSARSPLFSAKQVRSSALTDARWIIGPEGQASRHLLQDFLRLRDLAVPHVVLETESVPLRRQMVLESDLLSVFYRAQVQTWLKSKELRALPLEWPRKRRVGTLRPSASPTRVHDVFVEELHIVCRRDGLTT
ncbi:MULTISPECIES: LysR family transcriptional regulator [unclassified Variovorax]|uniref:LysR family transcriptional regulator n=1 Tax=unclassified Variovorax TaxID=663243 RepID=UPI001BD65C06|nr:MULTISPECIES: LysR family transcriptional regulator [unclassified Variovorax]